MLKIKRGRSTLMTDEYQPGTAYIDINGLLMLNREFDEIQALCPRWGFTQHKKAKKL